MTELSAEPPRPPNGCGGRASQQGCYWHCASRHAALQGIALVRPKPGTFLDLKSSHVPACSQAEELRTRVAQTEQECQALEGALQRLLGTNSEMHWHARWGFGLCKCGRRESLQRDGTVVVSGNSTCHLLWKRALECMWTAIAERWILGRNPCTSCFVLLACFARTHVCISASGMEALKMLSTSSKHCAGDWIRQIRSSGPSRRRRRQQRRLWSRLERGLSWQRPKRLARGSGWICCSKKRWGPRCLWECKHAAGLTNGRQSLTARPPFTSLLNALSASCHFCHTLRQA